MSSQPENNLNLALQTLLLQKAEWRIEQLKRRLAKSLGYMPTSSLVRRSYLALRAQGQIGCLPDLEAQFMTKRLRTLSGVAPFAVMMKAHPCPGKCTFCVTEKGMPKSYMSDEPAAQRALLVDFDPKEQVSLRLQQLVATGHEADKLQIIVIGGTFSAYPEDYKHEFLKGIFDGANGFVATTVQEAHNHNKTSQHRIVGLSIETRPDWITPQEIRLLRETGVTKVQLGVQTLDDTVNKRTRRGHTKQHVQEATALLRYAGFKINYHMMLNLPGAKPEEDIQHVETLFNHSGYQPDTIKLYPCIVLPKTSLYQEFKSGRYHSWSDETLINTLIACKQRVPPYCRIDRLTRDITSNWNQSGTQKTNLRQLLETQLAQTGVRCRCIRCREVREQRFISSEKPVFTMLSYDANDGKDYFLSFEQNSYLLAMLRLYLPPKPNPAAAIFPVLENAALIRELQVFGQQVAIGEQQEHATQHRHLGRNLVKAAEELATQHGFAKMAIISGVGVRGYYEKLGYHLEDTYMVRSLF